MWPAKPAEEVCHPLVYVVTDLRDFTFNIALFPDIQFDSYSQNSTLFSIINISICPVKY